MVDGPGGVGGGPRPWVRCPVFQLRAVFAQAVRRIMLNPEGLRQESRTIDDYTESRTFDSAVSASSVGFTDEEWAQLMPASASAAFSIRASGAPDDVHGVWSTSWRWPV